MAKNQPKPTASTQEHLDIEDIIDDLVIFKTGWVGLVMTTTALNFDLLSEAEQDATIYAYGAFLNSLTFSLEVLVRSKRADITSYFDSLQEAERSQPNPDLKRQIQKYEEFIRSIVQQKTILDKKFYLIINFSPLEMGMRGLGRKNLGSARSKNQLLAQAKSSLFPKRDHIVKQMARIGLSTKQLTTKELIELYYDIYNPAPTSTQRIVLDTTSYTTAIVEPAVEIPSPNPEGQIPHLASTQQPLQPNTHPQGLPVQNQSVRSVPENPIQPLSGQTKIK